jgi:tRNA U38,U39,U40 pseudouridine synthase TruA
VWRSPGEDAAETVETHLFAALHATRLIAPDATWSSCEYSRCGRTDKGVSALRQIVALRCRSRGEDVAPEAELDYVQLLNRQLPPDIRILNWRPAPPRFSARFSGRWRQYKYFFWDDGSMDLGAMRDAAARLVVRCACVLRVLACAHALTLTRAMCAAGRPRLPQLLQDGRGEREQLRAPHPLRDRGRGG